MVNSSPEYAITKPGIHHLKKRDKPLRTYGKRQSQPPESPVESPRKRVRWAENLTSDEPDTTLSHCRKSSIREETVSAKSDKETVSKGEEQEQVERATVAKESILNYFKRVTPPKEIPKAPKNTNHGDDAVETRPESVEQWRPKTRRKRILRIRSRHSTQSERESGDEDCDSATPDEPHTPLSEGGETLHNQQRRTMSSEKGRRQKARLVPQVQTTLNLSSQAAFSECKICDTVWNPLYPDDVKYHTKRHASHLRGKKRAIEDFEL